MPLAMLTLYFETMSLSGAQAGLGLKVVKAGLGAGVVLFQLLKYLG